MALHRFQILILIFKV